jgi:hypothetical protein
MCVHPVVVLSLKMINLAQTTITSTHQSPVALFTVVATKPSACFEKVQKSVEQPLSI